MEKKVNTMIENSIWMTKDEHAHINKEGLKMKSKDFFEKWKGKKVVMHCKTSAESEEFCKILMSNCFTWADGSSYCNSHFDEYGTETCYCWNVGCSCSKQIALLLKCEIIEFSNYIINDEVCR